MVSELFVAFANGADLCKVESCARLICEMIQISIISGIASSTAGNGGRRCLNQSCEILIAGIPILGKNFLRGSYGKCMEGCLVEDV